MMTELKTYKLGELCLVKHGFPFEGSKFQEHGKYIVLTPGNFYEAGGFKRVRGKEKYYSDLFPDEYLCAKDDLVVAMTQQAEGLLGSTALIPEDNLYLHNQRIGLITCNDELVDKLYLYYLFMTKSVRKQISDTASGTKIRHTSPDKIYSVQVSIPDIKIQRKNIKVLHAIDKKVEVNSQICSELEVLAKTLYDYWFVQFDFPDENGKPYRTSGGKMVWNEQLKREIPKGWEVINIGNFTTVATGKEDANFSSPNGKYKFFTCSQEALLCDTPAFSGQAVLIAGNGDFNVKHYSGKFNAYQRTYVLIPENSVYYGAMYISAKNQIQAFKNGSNGSIIKFITKGDVENIPFILPNDDSIFYQLNTLLEKIELCERENEELTKLRDWLLPMLMNGQARVE